MSIIKRIALFLFVNIAIIVLISTIVSIFGIDTYYLKPNGLDLTALAVMSLLWGFLGSFISLFLSKWIAKTMMRVKIIQNASNHQESKIFNIVSQISEQQGIKMPEIGIYDSAEINAFATGWSKNNSLVAVSSGLLNEMNDDEITGVIAHEMAHITNGDMVTMTLVQGLLNAFIIFAARAVAYLVQILMGKDREEIGGFSYWITSILFEILFGVLAAILVNIFSRWREFEADLGGAKIVGKQKMIGALKKLQTTIDRIDTSKQQASFSNFKISNRSGVLALFSSHPPLEKRIRALEKNINIS